MTTDGSGNWVVVWDYIVDVWNEDEDHDAYFARSTDNGATWTAWRALNTNAASDEGGDVLPQVAPLSVLRAK